MLSFPAWATGKQQPVPQQQPVTNAQAPSRLRPNDTAPSTPSDTATAIQTVADAYLSALGSEPANPGATVVVPSPPATDSGGGSMNAKTLILVAVIAAAAWFAYKKWGKGAASA